MGYEPADTYLPGTHGGAQVPQFVGQREEAARSYAASAGWSVVVRHVAPPRGHPDGFVLAQAPAAGSVAPNGAVLAVDVSRRSRFGDRHGQALLAGACVALASMTAVFAALWLDERQRSDQLERTVVPDTTLDPDTTTLDPVGTVEAMVTVPPGTTDGSD